MGSGRRSVDEEALTAYQRWKKNPSRPWLKEGAVGDRFDLGAFFYFVLLVLLLYFWGRMIFQPGVFWGIRSKPTPTPLVRWESYTVAASTPVPMLTPTPTPYWYVEWIVVPYTPVVEAAGGD